MRIIGGNFKGKNIIYNYDKTTRPLKDMVRESIFNIIGHSSNEFLELKDIKVLDLFSGTGSFGLECLSRGAGKVVFFENNPRTTEILKKNIFSLNLNKKTKIICENCYNIKRTNLIYKNFDLIFLDPPFKDKNVSQLIAEIKKLNIINNKSIIIIHRSKKIKENLSENLNILREKNYGLSKIIFAKIV